MPGPSVHPPGCRATVACVLLPDVRSSARPVAQPVKAKHGGDGRVRRPASAGCGRTRWLRSCFRAGARALPVGEDLCYRSVCNNADARACTARGGGPGRLPCDCARGRREFHGAAAARLHKAHLSQPLSRLYHDVTAEHRGIGVGAADVAGEGAAAGDVTAGGAARAAQPRAPSRRREHTVRPRPSLPRHGARGPAQRAPLGVCGLCQRARVYERAGRPPAGAAPADGHVGCQATQPNRRAGQADAVRAPKDGAADHGLYGIE
mmetsp:Transcript_39170/g.114397  ORF Transcript_39170/g.114397 Transcript_39170/m.114397 type:complete len:263 (+) Transcript_39170:157-945(+)